MSSPSLPDLLSALALGARSVSSLPLQRDSHDNDSDNEDDDEFAFRMSLPEFSSLNYEAQSLLKSLLRAALDEDNVHESVGDENGGLEDPILWEKCANACEALLDSVSEYLSGEKEEKVVVAVGGVADVARERAEGKYGQMLRGVVDMEKPQNVYQGFVTFPPQNSREQPFVPIIAFDSQKQMMLDSGVFTKDGHGLDTRYQTKGSSLDYGDNFKAVHGPSQHIEHPFREEIEELEYRPWQFDLSGVEAAEVVKSKDRIDEGVWIGTEDDLTALVKRIKDENIHEIAIDLEAHSHRTFAGFVCLMQLSIRHCEGANKMSDKEVNNISTSHDFLIDALALRHAISTSLGPILANPDIVKVMHGADSDIPWLQRDFGCYVINLFDTGRASRALKFNSAGLAFLLRKYAKVNADKSNQLADWRRRPLPEDMREYAVSDTRYLLDIYDQLRLELENHSSVDVSIKSVLDRSKDVCLIRYDKEAFRPLGYKFIMDGGKRSRAKKGLATYLKGGHEVTSDLSSEQEAALRSLYDWRDQTARKEDESVQYVCPNAALLRIASNRPSTVSALQRLVNPPPPLVLRRSQEILDILNALKTGFLDAPTSSLAAAASNTLKLNKTDSVRVRPTSPLAPASGLSASAATSLERKKVMPYSDVLPPPTPSRNSEREMLSPILGTDMLYDKAGWKSPPVDSNVTSESEDESKRQLLDIGDANKGYQSSHYLSHSLGMSPKMHGEHFVEDSDDRLGQRSAQLIHDKMIISLNGESIEPIVNGFDVMKYIRPYALKEKQDNILQDEDETTTPNTYENVYADNMIIPKSMSEVYSLSNVNRRRTNKDKPSSQTESKVDAEKLAEDDIEEAENILSRGGPGGYFGESKRQKPNSDMELVIKMGWIKNEEEVSANSDVVDTEQNKTIDNKQMKEGMRLSSDYYSTMGSGLGAFDPSAPASSNPFFTGAANSAAALFNGEKQKNSKSGKRNKKR